MEDARIVQLYWDRSEQAIQETDTKYGRYCYAIAYNILENSEDSEESVSDTYMAAWKAFPWKNHPESVHQPVAFHKYQQAGRRPAGAGSG